MLESLFIYILKQVHCRNLGNNIFTPEEMATQILSAPHRGRNSKFSQLYVVGTLNLCLETPGTMQNKLGQNKVAYRKSASYLVWKCLKSLSVEWWWWSGGGGGGGPTKYFVTPNLS